MSIRTRLSRRVVASFAALTTVAGGMLAVTAPAAHADGTGTLTVVGTSDVYDSFLVQSVIKPGFEAAHPDVSLNYISKGTGAAITYAEAGTASALLVHAASLENQFVHDGYSLEQYGRAIFYGDYVLLGPADDPAGVLAGASHDIVGAFQKIAAAGASGKANFVSRGGTPGTTVQEHAIWKLTSGVGTCDVSDANGGGTSPSTTGGACPSDQTYPGWYHATGLTQGPNLINADACSYTGGGCYVFTDRGTFQYLESKHSLAHLQIVTRDNAASATGGSTLLVNSFHAYAINPAKFAANQSVQLNSTAAKEFLAWITSPSAQAAIGNYLANSADGAPFIPDAAPRLSTSQPPKSVAAGKPVTVTGSIANVVPGTPALARIPVYLRSTTTADHVTRTVAHTTTDAHGKFTLTYKSSASGTYAVFTNAAAQVENAALNPIFGDLLAGTTSATSGRVAVLARVSAHNVKGRKGKVTGSVSFGPIASRSTAVLKLYGARVRTKSKSAKKLYFLAEVPLKSGHTAQRFTFHLGKGKWHVQFVYANSTVITSGKTRVRTVTVG